MSLRRFLLLLLLPLLLTAPAVPSASGEPVSTHTDARGRDATHLAERVIEHKLANGLTVLLVERHQSPVVSINMVFGVGGVNERTGATGIAHLYEHMAFKGTRRLGTKDYDKEQPLLEALDRLNREIEQLRATGPEDAPASGEKPRET
jgi:hypothetical protein